MVGLPQGGSRYTYEVYLTRFVQVCLTQEIVSSTSVFQIHGCHGEGIVKDFGQVMSTLLYLKWITNKTYCRAHGTLLTVMYQPG